jgi:Leucine-rich repeat (LRR) protein
MLPSSRHNSLWIVAVLCVLTLVVTTTPVVSADPLGSERAALVTLYRQTHGDEWTTRTSWMDVKATSTNINNEPSICNWYGIKCDQKKEYVISIDLRTNNLEGMLPSLCALTHLQSINMLANRALSGTLDSLCCHTSLTTIVLGQTNIDGGLPSCLATMSDLSTLDLIYNRMVGNDITVLDQLPKLAVLRLSGKFGGTFPSLNNVPSLSLIYLRNIIMNSSLPSGMCSWKQLTGVVITDTTFTGSIPLCFGNIPLRSWYIVRNPSINGAIPVFPPTIVSVRLQYNAFTSFASSTIANYTSLRSLTLTHNQLTSLPSLSNLPSLHEVSININRLDGNIDIASMLPLTLLDVSNNYLSGSLGWTRYLPSLASLNLANNLYNSAHISDLQLSASLRDLLLSDNLLDWVYPEMIWNDEGNDILGESDACPSTVINATSLVSLQVGHTRLKGSYATMLYCMNLVFPNLITLDVSHNELTTPPPPLSSQDDKACNSTQLWPTYLPWLQSLNISSNQLLSVSYIAYSRVPHAFITAGCVLYWPTVNLQLLDIRNNPM